MDVRKAIGAVVVVAGVAGYLPGVPGLLGGSDQIGEPPEELALADDEAAVERPPAPEVVGSVPTEPASFDDSLVRLVVTPNSDAAAWVAAREPTADPTPEPTTDLADEPSADDPSSAAEPTPQPQGGPGPDDVEPAVDLADQPDPSSAVVPTEFPDIPLDPNVDQTVIDHRLLDLLIVSAVLTFDEHDRPWAQWPDGARLPLWSLEEWPPDLLVSLGLADDPDAEPPLEVAEDDAPPTPMPTPTPTPEPAQPAISVGHPVMDAIAAAAGVDSVRSVGDGSFAVALEDPSLLDDFPVDVAEDTLMAISAEPYESYQWALDNTGANLDGVRGAPPQHADADVDGAEARTAATGAGIVVAVVDSGVDFGHPDLAPNRWTNDDEVCDNGRDDDANGFVDDCHGWDFAYDDNTPWNPGAHAHGTHVAGIIGAAENGEGVVGIAPEVELMDLNVGAITPSGRPGITTSAVARAIRYAADNGADIINLSLGTPPGSPRQGSLPVEQAILHAESRGVLVVAAAGNDGTNLDLAPGWPASYEFSNMITVGASTPTDSRAGFSNYGAVVDVFAPGVLILSSMPNGQLSFMSGTSQATPIVAGTAALALQARPGRTPGELRAVLVERSDRHEVLAPFVANGVRANAGSVVGVTDNRHGITDVAVEATGLLDLTDGEPFTTGLSIAMPEDHPSDPLAWEMTLLAIGDDATHALVELPIAVDGTVTATDTRGGLGLGLTGSGSVDLEIELPAGDYAMVLEAVPDDDPTSRIGDARVVRFSVASRSTAAPTSPADQAPPSDPVDGGGPSTVPDPPTQDAPSSPAAPAPSEPSTPADQPGSTEPPATDPNGTPTTPEPPGSPADDPAPVPPSDPTSPPSGGPGGGSPPAGPADDTSAPNEPSTPSAPQPQPAPSDPSAPAPSDPGGPAEPGSPPASPDTSGDWWIRSVSPSEGLIDITNIVELRGSFPSPAYVWFGDAPGTVLLQTPDLMIALTPARSTPGSVDVELRRTGVGSVATMIGGYTFVDPFVPPPPAPPPGDSVGSPADDPSTGAKDPAGGDTPPVSDQTPESDEPSPGSDAPSGPPASGPPSAGEPPTDEAPAAPTPTPAAPTSPQPTPGDPPADQPSEPVGGDAAPGNRQPRLATGTDIDVLANGLSGVVVVGGDPSRTAPTCSTNPCRLD